MPRRPFSLTYVTYEDGDHLGELCALLSLAPPFIVVAYATLLVARRDAHLAYILCGQLINGALNAILKATINQPRPGGCDHPGPGMPSDHSQFMAFWACCTPIRGVHLTSHRAHSTVFAPTA